MADFQQIFCKYALVGSNLTLKKNITVSIDSKGKISNIEQKRFKNEKKPAHFYSHHLLLPKFINSHIHLGDSALKDHAFELNLNEAVGAQGYKYNVKNLSKSQRISSMRLTLIEMIGNSTSTCFDFREGGLNGIQELREAAKALPIEIFILGRPDNSTSIGEIISKCDGVGFSIPLLFSQKDLEKIRSSVNSRNSLVAIHVGEDPQVIEEMMDKYGISDLEYALKYLNPNILVHLTSSKISELEKIPNSKFMVLCPRSNAYFALGFPPAKYLFNQGKFFGLGTDNVMTNSPNLLEEIRWLILRLKEQNITINPVQALSLITVNPSKVLNLSTGCIKIGFWADFIVLDLQTCRTSFGKDPISTIVFRAHLPEDISFNSFHGEIITHEFTKGY